MELVKRKMKEKIADQKPVIIIYNGHVARTEKFGWYCSYQRHANEVSNNN